MPLVEDLYAENNILKYQRAVYIGKDKKSLKETHVLTDEVLISTEKQGWLSQVSGCVKCQG